MTNLQELYLGWNGISDDGCLYISRMIETNTSIKKIGLGGTFSVIFIIVLLLYCTIVLLYLYYCTVLYCTILYHCTTVLLCSQISLRSDFFVLICFVSFFSMSHTHTHFLYFFVFWYSSFSHLYLFPSSHPSSFILTTYRTVLYCKQYCNK
jgi:hypothetical protein